MVIGDWETVSGVGEWIMYRSCTDIIDRTWMRYDRRYAITYGGMLDQKCYYVYEADETALYTLLKGFKSLNSFDSFEEAVKWIKKYQKW